MKVFHLFICLSEIGAEFLFLITTCGRTKTVCFLKVNQPIVYPAKHLKMHNMQLRYLEIKIFKMSENRESEPELHLPLQKCSTFSLKSLMLEGLQDLVNADFRSGEVVCCVLM